MLFQFVLLCLLDHQTSASEDSSSQESAGVPNPRTLTPYGALKGSWMETRKGRRFEAYRGIRYAEAPIGDLRFELPRPIHHCPTEVDASAEGPACPTVASEYYYPNFSEDCLRLNVYTPAKRGNASLPVVVFIHPGGFYGMSGRSDLAGPHYLLDRDLVLVTINYRLASFGFLSTGDELAPGNNGMKDQVAALRWINRNIRSLGGDPGCVTVAGSSAGAISVLLHTISPMSKGLFHRGIAMSGSPVTARATPREQRHLAVKQAQLLGCPTNSSRAIIECLRTKTWREIGDSLLGFYEFAYDPVLIWEPVVELDFGQPRFLDMDPLTAIKRGRLHAVPLIVSQTEMEFYWMAFTILNNATLLEQMNRNWTQIAPISFMLPREQDNTSEQDITREQDTTREQGTTREQDNTREQDTTKERGIMKEQDNAHAVVRFKQSYLNGQDIANDTSSERGLGRLYGDAVIGFSVFRLANLLARHYPERLWYNEFRYVGEHSHYEDPVTGKPIGAMHHDELIYLFSLSYRFPLIATGGPDSAFVDIMTALWYNFAKHGDPNPRGDLPELSSLIWPALTRESWSYLQLDRRLSMQHNLNDNGSSGRFNVWDELFPINYE